jgi:hypothetical protein
MINEGMLKVVVNVFATFVKVALKILLVALDTIRLVIRIYENVTDRSSLIDLLITFAGIQKSNEVWYEVLLCVVRKFKLIRWYFSYLISHENYRLYNVL